MRRLALHWQILIAMGLGIAMGFVFVWGGMGDFVADWIKPFGTIFISLLKVIAVPLVVVSLIKGVASMSDISQLSSMGGKTLGIYLVTTVVAVALGLAIVNVVQPGKGFSAEKREEFREKYASQKSTKEKLENAVKVKEDGPLQPLVNMFPKNFFKAASDNRNMLQVIVFSLLFGIALVTLPAAKVKPVVDLVESLNDIVIALVMLIMRFAPIGVFALLTSLIGDFAGDDPAGAVQLLRVLGVYSFCVIIGLTILTYGFYPLVVFLFGGRSSSKFLSAMFPAQMMAFSSSSSAATLPVTMQSLRKGLGVSNKVTSFVLPIGATVNMDGTSLYQGVAAVFIAQVYGIDLSLGAQLGILATATLASIGSAAVPGSGIVMLVIVLQGAGIPVDGITLILAPDRILDMCRTVTNVTGDGAVSLIIENTTSPEVLEETALPESN